ncbi:hypothetical protein [Nocardia altamirensis]|uniref:hypothetical protein n=1 Tax=Nocardia altamirensis TaxID=472158 RepID=UPI000840261A|nr:hypothetical protein [Nocardia altamirensis]
MSRTKLALAVIISTTAYLAVSFLLGDRPNTDGGWIGFAVGGALFAMLFSMGLVLFNRYAKQR